MSEWRDALIDYTDDHLPEDFDLLPEFYKKKVYEQLEKDFFENCERAEALWDGDR